MNTQIDSMTMVRKLAASELSLAARLGYVALLLLATGVTIAIVSLWLTEPALPTRTQLAFAAMTLIGSSWAAFALWALATRRRLFARDRVIAAWMAVVFSAMFVAGALAAVVISGRGAAFGAVATGAVMLAAAIRVLIGARRRFTALTARREELEQLLALT